MEEKDKTRTYLVLDEENIYNENFRILGYFSLATKSVQVAGKISKSKIKDLDGINRNAENIDCFLIGQLGKNEIYEDIINGKIILDSAIDIIETAKSFIGRRVILVESVDDIKVLQFYFDNGFEKIEELEIVAKDGKTEKLHQLIRRI